MYVCACIQIENNFMVSQFQLTTLLISIMTVSIMCNWRDQLNVDYLFCRSHFIVQLLLRDDFVPPFITFSGFVLFLDICETVRFQIICIFSSFGCQGTLTEHMNLLLIHMIVSFFSLLMGNIMRNTEEDVKQRSREKRRKNPKINRSTRTHVEINFI